MDSVLFSDYAAFSGFLGKFEGFTRIWGATSWCADKVSLKKKYKMGSSLFPGIANFPGKDIFPGGKNGE